MKKETDNYILEDYNPEPVYGLRYLLIPIICLHILFGLVSFTNGAYSDENRATCDKGHMNGEINKVEKMCGGVEIIK